MNIRGLALSLAFAVSALAAAPAGAADATATYGTNLVVNGDAESELGAPDSGTIVKPTGWTTTGQFTAVRYGASGGFPDATSPGPADRGKSLFEGGNVPRSTATQTIALSALAAGIDTATVTYDLSAWIGGYASQEDHATVSVSFEGTGGAKLGAATLTAVTATERKSTTGLIARSASGKLPKGTRSAVIIVTIVRETGLYNDGSVDDVSLVLKKP